MIWVEGGFQERVRGRSTQIGRTSDIVMCTQRRAEIEKRLGRKVHGTFKGEHRGHTNSWPGRLRCPAEALTERITRGVLPLSDQIQKLQSTSKRVPFGVKDDLSLHYS